jgi:prepilin-type N-terminal cleavage/methylation domain-containing protein
MKNKGFTLIELLVVIAIIALLSSVVLASLNTARNKGSNSAIKADLLGVSQQANITYYDLSGVYTNLCSDASMQKNLTGLQTVSGATTLNTALGTDGSATAVTCHSSATGWAVEAPLKLTEGTSTFWCADYNGSSVGESGTKLTANTVKCP